MTIRVGIDIDDCLFETTDAWLKRHNKIQEDNVTPEDVKSWDIAQYINKGNRETLFYILRQNDFWQTVNPVDGAFAYMMKLVLENDDIDTYIVSSTHPSSAASKMQRFFEIFPFIDEHKVILTAAKGVIDVHVMLDDNTENLCAARPGTIKILFDRPHNRWCDETGIGAVRVHDWKEAYEYITTLAQLESEDEVEA